jgi:hypothetical protein
MAPITPKQRDSLPLDMLLSDVSILVATLSSSELPEGRMNYPVYCVSEILLSVHHNWVVI